LGNERDPATGTAIKTKFMVDIISGTSAGGINGIYLAKALNTPKWERGVRWPRPAKKPWIGRIWSILFDPSPI
jgi:hypothetical protein